MASMPIARDFQWTSYEPPRRTSSTLPAPPPLPSLPPWANEATTPTLPVPSHNASSGGWRRPTSYFGAMKRLPGRYDDETRTANPEQSDEYARQQHDRDDGDETPPDEPERPTWPTRSTSHSLTTTNQHDEDERESRGAEPNPNQSPSSNHDCPTDDAGPERNEGNSTGSHFRPWKKSSHDDRNNESDPEGGSIRNKWKDRALFNPFAKRKAAKTTATAPPPEVQDEDPADAEPAVPSPVTVERSRPPQRLIQQRHDKQAVAMAVAPPPPMPLPPRTPPPPPESRRTSTPPLPHDDSDSLRPLRPPLRSRERRIVGTTSAVPDSDAVLRTDAASLRKSTTQLAPLDDARASNHHHHHLNNNNDDDNDDDVARVLQNVPAKPPTQLQQLRPSVLPKKPTAAPKKKVSTLDALNAIKLKREQRRNAQAEEKQRIKTELEQHGDDVGYKFRRLIQQYRDALPSYQQPHPPSTSSVGHPLAPSTSRLSVFVRKRPLSKKELKAKGYDILTCLFTTTKVTNLRQELICHEPKWKVDCSESLENHSFRFDGVFDEIQDNTSVYAATVGPLIPTLVPSTGGPSTSTLTVFAYGQTGSGKTYTMKSIYRQAATDLFARLGAASSSSDVTIGVSFYEIYMNQVNDLLNGRMRVQLLEDGDGMVQLLGLTEIGIQSADGLMELIQRGEESRATSANAVHDDSSRSHALLRVTLYRGCTDHVVARLSMVDLAGSERACDTQSDSKNTRMEGAEINKSLLALKECIRALDRNATHIPFRQSKLTQLLRDSFLSENSKTVMIATASPWSESCNHTLNTLRYADRLKEIGN